MLNSSSNADYKKLAKKTACLECSISEKPFGTLIVDFRSRVFRYMRLAYINRPLHEKINSIFLVMNEYENSYLDALSTRTLRVRVENSENSQNESNMLTEKKRVFHEALKLTKKEVALIKPKECVYVFCSPHTCPYKEKIKTERRKMCEKRLQELNNCMREFKRDVLNVGLLKKCCAALESYIMSDVENICAMYAGKEWLLGIETYTFPKSDNYYESDRLCANVFSTILHSDTKCLSNAVLENTRSENMTNSNSPAVLSEDLDCVVLFGAEFMIKEVFEQFISYVSLKDIMNTFGVKDRKDMVHRCCIMGTHFNLGLKGVGPVKIKQLDATKAAELFKTCIKHQHIDQKDFYKFFNL